MTVSTKTADAGDEDLMARVKRGDQAAFGQLFDRHSQVAAGLARRIVGESDAEDVTQAAFLDAWRQRARFRAERGQVRAWLLGIVRNRAIDELRRRRSRPQLTSSISTPETVGSEHGERPQDRPHACAVGRDEARVARLALGRLPEAQRTALELAYFGGLSQTQMAAHLGIPLGTVKGRIRLGLEKLEQYLVDPREPAGPTAADHARALPK